MENEFGTPHDQTSFPNVLTVKAVGKAKAVVTLHNSLSWLCGQERTAAVSHAEGIIEDATRELWDDMTMAEKHEYWQLTRFGCRP